MPKYSSFPTLYDDCKTVSITFLKQHGYLQPSSWRSGTINWSRNGNKTGSIGISVFTYGDEPYLHLDYKCNDKPVNYKVPLVTKPSNIGKGVIWYFRCPNTGKLCRKLYLADTYLLHRCAFKGCMYEKQTYSKRNREHFRQWEKLFCTDEVYEQLYSKGFKTHYKGKPTKRYKKLWGKLRQAGEVSEAELLSFIRGK